MFLAALSGPMTRRSLQSLKTMIAKYSIKIPILHYYLVRRINAYEESSVLAIHQDSRSLDTHSGHEWMYVDPMA